MKLVGKALDYLQKTNFKMINSNFLLADLNRVLYTTIISSMDDPYLDKPLSKDMQELIAEWSNKEFSEDLLIILNNNFKQIVEDDSTIYSAQMVFPIFINNKLDGFAIYFRTQGNYILSSSKAPNTIRNFLQKFLNDELEKEKSMSKEKLVSEHFENYLFSQLDLDYVWEKIDNNLPTLLGITGYLENEQKLTKINKLLVSTLNEDQRKLLNEYKKTSVDSMVYQYCLAYYLGQKAKIESDKLK